MATYTFPRAADLQQIEQVLVPQMALADPIFSHFPIVNVDNHLIVWEQKDNYQGLQGVRGMNGELGRVTAVGGKRYIYEPGVYGESMDIREGEITARRRWGTFGEVIDLTDLVAEKQEQLLQRRFNRLKYILWTLLSTGTFSVATAQGVVIHTDTYPVQTFTATVPWATVATATPIADLRAVQLLARGKGVSFGPSATLYLNLTTINNMLGNTNANDLGGRLAFNGSKLNSLADVNSILNANGLPAIQPYEGGYEDETSTWQMYLANAKGVLVGARDSGSKIGEYRMTRNANNPGAAPGPYTEVVMGTDPPKNVRVYDGHNGGPVIYFPGAVVRLNL